MWERKQVPQAVTIYIDAMNEQKQHQDYNNGQDVVLLKCATNNVMRHGC